MNTSWSDILHILRQRLPEGVFKVWVEPLQAQILPGNSALQAPACPDPTRPDPTRPDPTRPDQARPCLELTAPNAFVASWVKDRLSSDICRAAALVLGQEPELRVLVDDDIQSQTNRPLNLYDNLFDNLPAAPAVLASTKQLQLPVGLSSSTKTRQQTKQLKYAFSDFVVGPCNQLAHAAAQNILRTSAPVDMLFLCSGSGLGKTHLTQSVGKALLEEADRSQARVEYLTAEEFTTRFVMASRFGNLNEFKELFRNLDMLLLEDIHFLNGKDKTQEELLATIKSLQARGGRVVLTSSFAPRDLAGLDAQLVSRFCSGFIASLEKPDLDTRLCILERKARQREISLPHEVAELLAQRITADVRLLESCLHNLALKSQLLDRPISEKMALEVIQAVSINNPGLDLEQILNLVCRGFSLSKSQLASKSRRQELVLARNTAYYLLRKHTSLTLDEIGQVFNRKHSTVIKGITQLESEMSRQTSLGRQLSNTVKMIENNAV